MRRGGARQWNAMSSPPADITQTRSVARRRSGKNAFDDGKGMSRAESDLSMSILYLKSIFFSYSPLSSFSFSFIRPLLLPRINILFHPRSLSLVFFF